MRKTLQSRSLWVALALGYLFLGFLGHYLWQWWGMAAGLALAFCIDRLCPRWAVDLSMDELTSAIHRHNKYGCMGSRLHIRMGENLFIVFRDSWRGEDRIGVQLPLSDWGDLLTEDFLKTLHERCAATEFRTKWRRIDTVCLAPLSGVSGCVQILEEFLRREGIEPGALAARVDCARKDIWCSK